MGVCAVEHVSSMDELVARASGAQLHLRVAQDELPSVSEKHQVVREPPHVHRVFAVSTNTAADFQSFHIKT